MKYSQCKGCNKRIVWGILWGDGKIENKRIPLDPQPAVYEVSDSDDGVVAVRRKNHMVSHFITCPERSQFSGKGK